MKEEHKEKLEQAKDKAKEFYRRAKEPNPITRTAKSIGDVTLTAIKRNPIDATVGAGMLIGLGILNGHVGDIAEADGFFMVDDLGDV